MNYRHDAIVGLKPAGGYVSKDVIAEDIYLKRQEYTSSTEVTQLRLLEQQAGYKKSAQGS
jgi:hypothetical protein